VRMSTRNQSFNGIESYADSSPFASRNKVLPHLGTNEYEDGLN